MIYLVIVGVTFASLRSRRGAPARSGAHLSLIVLRWPVVLSSGEVLAGARGVLARPLVSPLFSRVRLADGLGMTRAVSVNTVLKRLRWPIKATALLRR